MACPTRQKISLFARYWYPLAIWNLCGKSTVSMGNFPWQILKLPEGTAPRFVQTWVEEKYGSLSIPVKSWSVLKKYNRLATFISCIEIRLSTLLYPLAENVCPLNVHNKFGISAITGPNPCFQKLITGTWLLGYKWILLIESHEHPHTLHEHESYCCWRWKFVHFPVQVASVVPDYLTLAENSMSMSIFLRSCDAISATKGLSCECWEAWNRD